MSQKTGFQRLMHRIHTHPRARLLEFLFWGIPGLGFLVAAWGVWYADIAMDAIPLLIGLVGVVLVGWGLVPPPQRATETGPELSPRSKRSRRAR